MVQLEQALSDLPLLGEINARTDMASWPTQPRERRLPSSAHSVSRSSLPAYRVVQPLTGTDLIATLPDGTVVSYAVSLLLCAPLTELTPLPARRYRLRLDVRFR